MIKRQEEIMNDNDIVTIKDVLSQLQAQINDLKARVKKLEEKK